jgi:FkbM family methyltransferase
MSTQKIAAELLAEQNRNPSSRGTLADRVYSGLDLLVRGMGRGLKSRLRAMAPRQLKKHRILAGPLRGCRIVTSWQHYHTGILGTVEHGLIAWFDRNVKPGETWLDIGANYGYTALALGRRVGSHGRVFAFEPKLSTCGCLSQTMLLNGLPEVTVVPVGLGSPEAIEFKQLATVGGMVAAVTEVGGTALPESVETIAVAQLDWLWPRICGSTERIDGAKIDVQGMELEVVNGMRGLLKRYHPKLAIELHSGVDRVALLDLLESCGYSRLGKPIYSVPGEEREPQYYDNLTYEFTGR